MNRTFLIVAGSLLLAAPAIAQPAERSYDQPDRGSATSDHEGDGWRSRGGDEARGRWSENERGARNGDQERGMRRGGGRGRGAKFVIKSGDTLIRVKCDAQESMRACVDAVTTLMERSRGMTGTTPVAPPPPPKSDAKP